MIKIVSKLNKKYHEIIGILAAVLVLVLPFSMALPNLLLIPLLLIVLINFKKINWAKSSFLIFFGLAILILTVFALLNGSFINEIGAYSRYFLTLLLFLLFMQVKHKKYVEHALLISVFVAILISLAAIFNYALKNPFFLLDRGGIVNKLLIMERPYFGFALSLGVFICLKNAKGHSKRFIYYLLALIFAAFTIYIAARLAIGLIFFLFFIYLLKNTQLYRKSKIWISLILIFLFAIAIGLSDNLISRMHIKDGIEKTFHLIQVYEPRLIIWPCAVNTIQNDMNIMTGLDNYGEVEERLTQCYAQAIEREGKRHYYLETKFNSHNQFLDFFLIGGIVPFLLLICMFIQAWVSKSNNFELKLLLLLFFAFFMVENVLHRQLGCYLFGVFCGLYSNKINTPTT